MHYDLEVHYIETCIFTHSPILCSPPPCIPVYHVAHYPLYHPTPHQYLSIHLILPYSSFYLPLNLIYKSPQVPIITLFSLITPSHRPVRRDLSDLRLKTTSSMRLSGAPLNGDTAARDETWPGLHRGSSRH